MRQRPNFESLEVYQIAEQLADSVWDLVNAWQNLARDTVGKQLIRSADSIGANIAEGCGRGTYADNKHFVDMARGALNETTHWLRRAHQRKLIPTERTRELRELMDTLGPKLNAYRNGLKARIRASRRPSRSTPTID